MAKENSTARVDEQPAGEAPRLPPGRAWVKDTKEVLVAFLPGTLKQIVEKGLLKAFLVLFAVIVILPPLTALLAAYWLKVLANVDGAATLRAAYLRVIHEGFSIEEVASRSNVRLDYLQLFEYDLRQRAPNRELRLSLEPMQKAAIDIRLVTFKADEPTCNLPEEDIDLITVLLGDQPIRTLRQESNITIDIGKKWWQNHAAKFDADDLVQRLSFRLTDKAKQLSCGRVHIEGGVRVFKDLLFTSQKN